MTGGLASPIQGLSDSVMLTYHPQPLCTYLGGYWHVALESNQANLLVSGPSIYLVLLNSRGRARHRYQSIDRSIHHASAALPHWSGEGWTADEKVTPSICQPN